MKDINKFILESKKYFAKRGWINSSLFDIKNDMLYLYLSYFFTAKNIKTNRYYKTYNYGQNLSDVEILIYTEYVFQHIRDLWVKHKIGNKIIICGYGSDQYKRLKIHINAEGYILTT